MALIEDLRKDLDSASDLVKTSHEAIRACQEDGLKPMAQLEIDLQELPPEVGTAKLGLTGVSTLVSDARRDLQRLQDQLVREAARLTELTQHRIDTLESAGQHVQRLVKILTASVATSMTEIERRAGELKDDAVALAGGCNADLEACGKSAASARAALDNTTLIVQQTYDPNLFSEMAAALKALQNQLDLHRAEVLPDAVTDLRDKLSGEHLSGLQERMKDCANSAQATHSDYLDKSRRSALQMQMDQAAQVKLSDDLVRVQLRERAAMASTKSQDLLHKMTHEAASNTHTCEGTATHLKQKQDPWLAAVEALHLALQGMVR